MTRQNEKKLFLLKELAGTNKEIDLFEEIFYQFPDIIHSVDEQGCIVAFNAKACELLGYSADELLGMSVFDVYAPEVREDLKKGFNELKRKGQKEGVQSKVITKSREIIDVEVRSLSLYDSQGSFVKTLSILRDMRELNYLRSSLIQQSKLAAIGELAAGIMHDIRNPLSIIVTYNELIEMALGMRDFARIKKASEKIGKAAQRIERLSNHLREFVRAEADEPQEFKISELVEESLLMVETRIMQSGVNLQNTLQDCEYTVVGRLNRLEQVIINLISNACDACADRLGEKIVSIKAKKNQDHIAIHIKDNGSGIKKENLANIFDAFFTTKPKGKGTGLGLSICKGIIEDQGGTIDVISEFGKGAEFIVSLPFDCSVPLKKDNHGKKSVLA